MEKREALLAKFHTLKNKILPYVYPDFKEAKLFSKQYHDIILRNIFDNASIPYAQIYGDGNEIRKINDLYGKPEGDLALNYLFLDIKKVIPEDATISRLGGDEISILIPNATKEDASNYEKKIHKITRDDSGRLRGITISLASSDSSEGNLMELEKKTEAIVEDKKHSREQFISRPSHYDFERLPLELPSNSNFETEEHWKQINQCIYQAIDNYFSDTRPSLMKRYSTNDILKQSDTLLAAIQSLLQSPKDITLSDELVEPLSYIPENAPTEFKDSTTCSLVHRSITEDDNSVLNELDDTQLNTLIENLKTLLQHTLSRNSNSNLLNNATLRYDLMDKIAKSSSSYQAVFFSISGIKSSNTAYGHNHTDMRMRETANLLYDTLSENIDFCDDIFHCNDTDSFLIDKGGGNYVAILSEDDSLSNEELQEYITKINTHYSPDNTSSTFMLSTAFSQDYPEQFPNGFLPKDKDKITYGISFLKNECNENKMPIKQITMNDITSFTAFKKRIYPAFDFYRKHIPDWNSNMNSQRLFVSNIFRSLINTEACHNYFERKTKSEVPLEKDFEL